MKLLAEPEEKKLYDLRKWGQVSLNDDGAVVHIGILNLNKMMAVTKTVKLGEVISEIRK